ncbi:putative pentatricopeptide repeat-containing protein At5g09950 [Impatiens glandulifera]|uniref:putative pentatricopeptide repeat-containing protein At5g09950 n=1 Tax=Impatiens glandulifera TaxID=253017 RepID=UPI001FB0671C|nr:putative pentatricopeptide repeat-containing protein At5g09950 [Impatiens glandulifera]
MFLCNIVSLRIRRISLHSNYALNSWAVSLSYCKESILNQTLHSKTSDSDHPVDSLPPYLTQLQILVDHYNSAIAPPRTGLPSPIQNSEDYYEFLIHNFRFSSSHTVAKQLHLLFIKNGLIGNNFCSNTIKSIYARTGDIIAADKLFAEMPQRNYTQNGISDEACTDFIEIVRSGVYPSSYTFGSVLKACIGLGSSGLRVGLQIHGLILKTPYVFDVSMSNVLILMYGNSRNLVECAYCVFYDMHIRDVISWNSIISVCSHRGDLLSAFELFSQMQQGFELDVRPNEYTFGSLLSVASSVDYNCQCLLEQMLSKSMKYGIMHDLYVGSALVSGLTRVGLLDIAKNIFQQMNVRNVATMNGLMVGLVKQRQGEEATVVFREMEGLIERNSKSYSILMSSFTEFSDLKKGKNKGKEVHAHVMRAGLFDSDVSIGNALINMYAKCGAIFDACSVFELMVCKDSVSWNSIISSFDQNEDYEGSVLQFQKMRRIGLMPSNFTFISALSSCGSLGWINIGKQIHGKGIQVGLDLDISVSNVLICLYSMTGFSSESLKVFSLMSDHDRVSWNSIIRALADSEEHLLESLRYFIEMMRVGWSPNDITIINVLSSVSSHSVHQVHALAVKYCLANETTVENTLLSCYGKSGHIDECEKIFSLMSERRNEIAWNSMILGYIHNDQLDKAMDLVSAMLQTGKRLDSFTFATVLSACASVSMLERGMEIHGCSIRACLESDVVVGSALVDMYAKCGRIDYAVRFFDSMPFRNLYTWNAMISGFASHGSGYEALELFTKMSHSPDHVTFVAVLSACSHVGLVEEGFKHFESMSKIYDLAPKIEHFSCMVDVLGRAGELNKMDEFIRRMPIEPNELIWRTVLAACSRSNGLKTDLGRKAAKKLKEMEPQNAVNYILLANMYAAGESWINVEEAREAMRESAAKKEVGCSWVG